MPPDLNDTNFTLYAASVYENPNYTQAEFEEDIKRFKYIKRLIKRYRTSGNLKERLILNHIIVLSNVFGTGPTVRMLFFKIEPEDYAILKTFLLFLNYMPQFVPAINGKTLISADITVDIFVGKRLRDTTLS